MILSLALTDGTAARAEEPQPQDSIRLRFLRDHREQWSRRPRESLPGRFLTKRHKFRGAAGSKKAYRQRAIRRYESLFFETGCCRRSG